MSTSRKCPSCEKWSDTEAENCPLCGAQFDSVKRDFSSAILIAEERKEKNTEYLNSGNFLSRAVKKTGWLIHLIFGALSTFFVWWIAFFHY